MKPWQRIEPTTVRKVGRRTIVTKTFKLPDGRLAPYQTYDAEGSRCVATVALTQGNRVIIARQFRAGPERIFDELPGGGVNEDETDLEAAARRELREETGYRAGTIQLLGTTHKSAYQNNTWYYFFATGCVLDPTGQQLDDDEYIEVRLITVEDLINNAKNARLSDIDGVFLAYDELMKLKEQK